MKEKPKKDSGKNENDVSSVNKKLSGEVKKSLEDLNFDEMMGKMNRDDLSETSNSTISQKEKLS